jgi:hypothetical protein
MANSSLEGVVFSTTFLIEARSAIARPHSQEGLYTALFEARKGQN